MTQDNQSPLQPPRYDSRPAFQVTGLLRGYTMQTNHGIPALWGEFVPHIGTIPGGVPGATYGVCCHFDGKGGFDYMAGVETAPGSEAPTGLVTVSIPEQRYIIFTHDGPIAEFNKTMHLVHAKGLPESGAAQTEGPQFEYYNDDHFDGDKGIVEIWIPIA